MDKAQMCQRCHDGAVLVGISRLSDYRFIINNRGVATIVPQTTSEVYGIVWSITETCEKSLDKCEGVKYGTYTKETMNVEIANESVPMLVYLARDSTPGSAKANYMEKIVAAAEQHKLPDKYLEELRTWLKRKQ
jgi:gamma-glutamylcyclotransferase (GGCT)/AIG2-like uncharacterized protein YtfP